MATVNYLPGSTQINIHSIKKWVFYYLSGCVPQNDWHTVLALFCITTAYQTQLVHGSHRSAYDPEKFSKAWEIAESLFGKKKWNFRENSKNLNDIKMDWSHFYLWFVKNILLHGRTSFWENLEAVPHVQYLTFCIIWSAQLYFDQEICYRKLQTFIWQPHSIWLEDCK